METGPAGWTMPVCLEGEVGGKIRYEWSDGQAVVPPHGRDPSSNRRIARPRRAHAPARSHPDNHVVTTFTHDGEGTLMTMRMTLPDAEVCKAMLASGMEHGMEDSYARLERISGWKRPSRSKPAALSMNWRRSALIRSRCVAKGEHRSMVAPSPRRLSNLGVEHKMELSLLAKKSRRSP